MSAYKPTPPEPVSTRGRQGKASKGHSILTAGFRRLRTLSGAYHGRSSSDLTGEQPLPVPVLHRALSDQNQMPSNLPSGAPQCSHPIGSLIDSGPLPPSLSQLRGIHFVPDAKQDPDLDKASTITQSRPQSTQTRKTSGASGLDDITNSSTDQNPSYAVSWSEPREEDSSSSPTSLLTFDDSSTGTNDGSSVIGGVLHLIYPTAKMPQLSPRACQAAYPPIDLHSPYAPYAPTSPLSATSVQDCNTFTQNHTTTISNFNMRMGLRHLPSIVPKPLAKHHPQSHPTNQPQMDSNPSTLDIHVEKSDSSTQMCPLRPSNESNGFPLTCPVDESCSDQSSRAQADLLHTRSGKATPTVEPTSPKSGVFKGKLSWSGKSKHHHSRSVSASRSGNIPFPCSTHDDNEISPKQRRERNSSEGAKSQCSKIWALPINRLRTSSSISTLIRGMKSTLRRSPSEISFETSPFSVRTESFYEILDASAIPPSQ